MLIVFEGIDGVGKTTNAQLIADKIRKTNRHVLLTKEPGGGGEFSKEIRRLLMQFDNLDLLSELFAIYAARNEHLNKVIIPAITNGDIVICDRYYFSSVAYFCCEEYSKERQKIVEQLQSLLPNIMPDVYFVCDIKENLILNRIQDRGIQSKYDRYDIDRILRIKNIFLDLAKNNIYNTKIIDCSHSIDDSQKQIEVCLKDLGLML